MKSQDAEEVFSYSYICNASEDVLVSIPISNYNVLNSRIFNCIVVS